MRKYCLLGVLMLLAFVAKSQEIGVRWGDASVGKVAVDGVFSTGKLSRVHADVSFGDGNVGIDALWDFAYRPLGAEALNWYAGVGPYTSFGDNFRLGAIGEIGLEYHFKGAPLAIGGDWRPYLQLIDETEIDLGGFGLNLRYVF